MEMVRRMRTAEEKSRARGRGPACGGGVGVAGPVGPGVVNDMPTGVLMFRGSDPPRGPTDTHDTVGSYRNLRETGKACWTLVRRAEVDGRLSKGGPRP